jgi:hypothetical protein
VEVEKVVGINTGLLELVVEQEVVLLLVVWTTTSWSWNTLIALNVQ